MRGRVSALAERGEDFLGEGQTIDVSHDGASIMVDHDLSVGQTIKVRRVSVNKEGVARVVGYYKDHASNSRVFGIALTENNVNLWDIVFPTNAGPDKAVLRALLRCVACGRLEVSYLRNSALGNEVVLVSDLGPGGLSFFSTNLYPEGATIDMAIPYTSKAPNIFSLVRIVGARKGKDRNLSEYRATYLV